MPLGIPPNLLSSCSATLGTINLSWDDSIIDCTPTPSFTCSSGNCDEILKSSGKQWTLTNALGSVVWGVSGTGASIDQNGNVTTTGAACGTLTITATDSCCGVFTQKVRVTDGGTWVTIFSSNPSTTGCTGCGGGVQCQLNGYIVGDRRYYVTRSRLSNIGGCPTQAQWDAYYNAYLAAGGIDCSATSGGCILSSYNMYIRVWSCP